MAFHCLIALGSNLGESLAILDKALRTLDQHPQIEVIAVSSWYQTTPVGPPQPDYINGGALLKTELSPQALLATLLQVEVQAGRVRKERWGARNLDLDIILYDTLVLDTPQLQIPHPRMRERAFVLVPLAEIAPDWIDPISGSVIAHLAQAVDSSGVKKL
jgi:2-amino-4-hydroxy-6-hydroxymethyldihydropteridine diphosphokinase